MEHRNKNPMKAKWFIPLDLHAMRGLVLPALLCIAASGNAQWTPITVPSQQYQIITINTYGTNEVLLMGPDCSRSLDGGNTWAPFDPVTSLGAPLTSAYGEVARLGHDTLIGATSMGSTDQYVMLRSLNGGTDWTIEYVSTTGANWPLRFHDVSMVNPSGGWAAGTNGRIVQTGNAGNSWTAMPSPVTTTINQLCFWTSSNGVVLTDDKVYRTTNSGSFWFSGTTLGTGFKAMHKIPNGAVAAGNEAIAITTNLGQNWTVMPVPFGQANDVFAFNEDSIYVATTEGLFVTFNGGAYWSQYTDLSGIGLDNVTFVNPSLGYCSSGTQLYRTTTGGGALGPLASFTIMDWTGQCGTLVKRVTSTALPSATIEWYYDWTLFGTGTEAFLTLTDSVNTGTIAMVVSDGGVSDTTYWQDTIFVQQPFVLDAGPDIVLCENDTVALQVIGPPGLLWSPSIGLSDPTSNTPLCWATPRTYTVSASVGMCDATDTLEVMLPPEPSPGNWSLVFPWTQNVFPFAMGAYSANSVAVFNNDRMQETFDGGLTTTDRTIREQAFTYMLNPFVGFAVDEASAITRGVMATRDGWLNYEWLRTDDYETRLQHGSINYRALKFYTDSIGYISSYRLTSYDVIRTDDRGAHWDTVYTSPNYLPFAALFTDSPETLFVHSYSTAAMLYSHDGGVSWNTSNCPLNQANSNSIIGVERNGDGDLFFYQHTGNLHWMYRSADGGQNWTRESFTFFNLPPVTQPEPGLLFINADTAYLMDEGVRMTVDGGDCWQNITDGFGFDGFGVMNEERMMALAPGGQVYRQDESVYQNLYRLFDPATLPRSLDLMVNEYSLCEAHPLQVMNGSQGYDSYSWFLDGASLGNTIQPAMPALAAGPHTLLLLAHDGLDTDSVSRSFTIHPSPAAPPIPIALSLNCESYDSVGVYTTGVPGATHYEWHALDAGSIEHLQQGDTAYIRRSQNHLTHPTYQVTVSAINQFGCRSPWSDTLIMPFTFSTIAQAFPLSGPTALCLDPGVPDSSFYTCATVPGSLGYVWTFEPDSVGSIVSNDTTATVYWNGTVGSWAQLRVSTVDICGPSQPLLEYISMDEAPIFIDQVEDTTVTQGDDATLDFLLSYTAFSIVWRHNGVVIPGALSRTLTIPNAQLADAGSYWATGNVLACDDVEPFATDTAVLTVIPANYPVSIFLGPDTVCRNQPVQFVDQSTGPSIAWAWSFPGGSPSTSNLPNPTVTYPNAGLFNVSMTASSSDGPGNTASDQIQVMTCTGLADEALARAHVYPVPTSDLLYVNPAATDCDLELKDMHGRTLLTQQHVGNGHAVDLGQFASGRYVLILRTRTAIRHFPVEVVH
jgi:photosystem II stability/assembly factor-like uncharacterized protein